MEREEGRTPCGEGTMERAEGRTTYHASRHHRSCHVSKPARDARPPRRRRGDPTNCPAAASSLHSSPSPLAPSRSLPPCGGGSGRGVQQRRLPPLMSFSRVTRDDVGG